jgi:hypothetical protein
MKIDAAGGVRPLFSRKAIFKALCVFLRLSSQAA